MTAKEEVLDYISDLDLKLMENRCYWDSKGHMKFYKTEFKIRPIFLLDPVEYFFKHHISAKKAAHILAKRDAHLRGGKAVDIWALDRFKDRFPNSNYHLMGVGYLFIPNRYSKENYIQAIINIETGKIHGEHI